AVKTERASNLGDGQALTIPAVADLGERLVVDHDRPPPRSGWRCGSRATGPGAQTSSTKRRAGTRRQPRDNPAHPMGRPTSPRENVLPRVTAWTPLSRRSGRRYR